MATKQTSIIRNQRDVLIQLHLVIHHRTNLQEIELACLVIMKIDSKLNFHRTRHLLLSIEQHLLQEFRQWEHAILQHTREGDDLAILSLIVAIVNALVIRVKRGNNPLERAIVVGIANGHLLEVEGIIHLECQRCPIRLVLLVRLHIQRIELCLRFPQGNLHLTCLQHLIRMMRTDTQTETSIHDVLSQSKRQFHYTLIGSLIPNGIVVDATSHT